LRQSKAGGRQPEAAQAIRPPANGDNAKGTINQQITMPGTTSPGLSDWLNVTSSEMATSPTPDI
jgi:hypothetical protein